MDRGRIRYGFNFNTMHDDVEQNFEWYFFSVLVFWVLTEFENSTIHTTRGKNIFIFAVKEETESQISVCWYWNESNWIASRRGAG